jgi:hypothetical protein
MGAEEEEEEIVFSDSDRSIPHKVIHLRKITEAE